jgi:hypothetical protein
VNGTVGSEILSDAPFLPASAFVISAGTVTDRPLPAPIGSADSGVAMIPFSLGSIENDGGSGVWIVVNGSPAWSAGAREVKSSVSWSAGVKLVSNVDLGVVNSVFA